MGFCDMMKYRADYLIYERMDESCRGGGFALLQTHMLNIIYPSLFDLAFKFPHGIEVGGKEREGKRRKG